MIILVGQRSEERGQHWQPVLWMLEEMQQRQVQLLQVVTGAVVTGAVVTVVNHINIDMIRHDTIMYKVYIHIYIHI